MGSAETSAKISDSDINSLRKDGTLFRIVCGGCTKYINSTRPWVAGPNGGSGNVQDMCSDSPSGPFTNSGDTSEASTKRGIDCSQADDGMRVVYGDPAETGCHCAQGTVGWETSGQLYIGGPCQ
jgi:hypothetical protein